MSGVSPTVRTQQQLYDAIGAELYTTPNADVIADIVASIPSLGGGGGGLPSWITTVDTPGSESATFAGAVDINPGRDVSALILRGFAGNVEHIMRAYNDAGDLVADIDANGITDVIAFNVQVPPDVGGGAGASGSQVLPSSWRINSGNDTSADPLVITKWDGAASYTPRFRVTYSNQIIITEPMNNEVSWTLTAPAVPGTDNAIEMWDSPFDNRLFSLLYTGQPKLAAHSAPADAAIDAGECALWFDQTNGASKLMIKAKQADGTVRTAAVALA